MKLTYLYLATATLLLVCAVNAQKEQPPAASPDWFQQAAEQIKEIEYGIYSKAGNTEFRVTNRANALQFSIRPNGYSAHSTRKGNNWSARFEIRTVAGRPVSPEQDFVIVKRKTSIIYQAAAYDIEYANDN